MINLTPNPFPIYWFLKWCMVAVKYLIPRDKFGCSFLLVLWSNGMYKSAPCLGDFQAVYGGDVAPCFLSLC
ncbi:hypothetical protein ACOSQ4_011960 [Xanthoceras sorbifolium]